MSVYRTHGTLTGTIERENLAAAQAFLTQANMTEYIDPSVEDVVQFVEWTLEHDGHHYTVTVMTTRDLTADESSAISGWISGQNSDGLGESFEQQPFAEQGDCGECEGCDEFTECEAYGMISFDWPTNKSLLTKVA